VYVELVFILARNRHRIQVLRCAPDRLSRETYPNVRIQPAHAFNPRGRNQDLFAWPPIPRTYLYISDRPCFVIHKKSIYVSDSAIGGSNVITLHGVTAPQMRIRRGLRNGVCGDLPGICHKQSGGILFLKAAVETPRIGQLDER
jgi:hypothetical protein